MNGRWIGRGIVALALMFIMAGCKPDPCPVAEDMVEASRAAASEAQRGADEVASRKQDLESQIQSKQERIRELEERKSQIEAELAELLGT